MMSDVDEIHFLFGDILTARMVELEVIAVRRQLGLKVLVVFCDAVLSACTLNPQGSKRVCNACIHRTKYHLRLLGSDVPCQALSDFVDHDKKRDDGKSSVEITPDYLRKLDTPVPEFGYGVLSSTISATRDMNFRETHTKLLARRLLSSAGIVFDAAESCINTLKPRSVVVHNGRLAEYCTIFLVSKSLGVNVFTNEIVVPTHKWFLFQNHRVHDKRGFNQLKEFSTSTVSDERITETSERYFSDKRDGKTPDNHTVLQEKGLVLHCNHLKPFITIYTSSEDEFASIGPEWENNVYQSQYDGICRIINDSNLNSRYHFVIRLHPNMRFMHEHDVIRYKSLASSGVTVEMPESRIDSYSLLDKSEKIVTFGSTIGLEATYWGKAVVQVGPSYFDMDNVTYTPVNHDEVLQLLGTELEPKAKTNGHHYVFTIVEGGFNFKHSNSSTRSFSEIPFLQATDGIEGAIQSVCKSHLMLVLVARMFSFVRRLLE